jgi:hypothetical protein
MSASFSRGVRCSILRTMNKISTEETMRTIFGRLAAALLALVLTSGLALAQTKITVAVGGGACLCYLPTVLAKQRRQRRRGFGLFRSLRQPGRKEAGAAGFCGL